MEQGNPTVLIADDEAALVELFSTYFENDVIVETALNGDEAIERLDDTVDVVLLDRRMPRMSGDEVAEYIRENGLRLQDHLCKCRRAGRFGLPGL